MKFRITYSVEGVSNLEPLYKIIRANDEITARSKFAVMIIDGDIEGAFKLSDVKILFVKEIDENNTQ